MQYKADLERESESLPKKTAGHPLKAAEIWVPAEKAKEIACLQVIITKIEEDSKKEIA